MKIYLASSWRNAYQPTVRDELRNEGHEVYDVRNPWAGTARYDGRGVGTDFQWSEIDPAWQDWTPAQYRRALQHPTAIRGFCSDFEAMKWADAGVLLLPSGRSAHLEAGWFAGAGKPLHILMPEQMEPELMNRIANSISLNLAELLMALGACS